jgi:hypothetical protein
MITKEKAPGASFQELKCLFLIHTLRQRNKSVNMLRHNRYNKNLYAMLLRNFANTSFAKMLVLKLSKHLLPLLCYPPNMPKISSNLIVIMPQLNTLEIHSRCLHATKKAHTNFIQKKLSAPNPSRTHFTIKMLEKTYGGKSKAIPPQTKVCNSILAQQNENPHTPSSKQGFDKPQAQGLPVGPKKRKTQDFRVRR